MFPDTQMNDEDEMGRDVAKKYRGIAARLNYLSPDRMDIGFAVKEAARNMSKPLVGDGPSSTASAGTSWEGRGL